MNDLCGGDGQWMKFFSREALIQIFQAHVEPDAVHICNSRAPAPREALCQAVKLNPGLPVRPQDVGDARARDPCRGKLLTRAGTSPRKRSVL